MSFVISFVFFVVKQDFYLTTKGTKYTPRAQRITNPDLLYL